MKIGINLLPIRKELTGIGVYAFNIISEFDKLDNENEYVLFANEDNYKIYNFENPRFTTIKFPFSAEEVLKRILIEQLFLPFTIKANRIDVLFSPSTIIPIFSGCKNVVCIHDMIPFFVKQKFSKIRSKYVKMMIKISAKRADKIFTVSNNSKKEIQKICKVRDSKIVITPNGIKNKLRESNPHIWNLFKNEKLIKDKYLLYVGTLEPGKNLTRLVQSFEILKTKYNLNHQLVITGKKGWQYNEIFKTVEKLKIEKSVIFTDYVSNEILYHLYKNAELFIFPSLYEGFGLPVLEAMALGLPAIVSNTSSMPELVGNACRLVDPYAIEEIADEVFHVLNDAELRQQMVRHGKLQAQKFNWQDSAKIAFNEISKVVATM